MAQSIEDMVAKRQGPPYVNTMSKGYHLNVKLDPELYRALSHHADGAALNLSEATRDLLRHALATVTSHDQAMMIEARNRAIALVKKAVATAIASIPEDAYGRQDRRRRRVASATR